MNKQETNKNPAALKKIELLRKRIDKLDTYLIAVLKRRFQIVKQIGALKKEMNLPVFQKSRWTNLIRDRIKMNQGSDGIKSMSSLFIRDLFTLIHSESLDLQQKLRKSKMREENIKDSRKNWERVGNSKELSGLRNGATEKH